MRKNAKIKDLLSQIYLQFVIGRRKGNPSLSILIYISC